MFSGASNFVEGVDKAFMFILGVSIFFLLAITVTMLVFVFKYNRKRNQKAVQIKENIPLEITWTVIPLIIVLVMFYFGYVGFAPMRDAPKDAMVIKAVGYMWDWEFEYADGKTSRELVVPLNKAVKLEMTSRDVIHSLYIPAFRVKEDMVPGMETYMWFIPQMLGEFEVLCAEYCGLRHSYMETVAKVVEQDDYEKWLAEMPVKKDLDNHLGLELIKKNACIGCHSLDGSKLVGSSFKGLYGSERVVVIDGKESTLTADEDYLKSSITNPGAEIVKGFSPLMQAYDKLLTDEELDLIVDYLKSMDN